MDKINLPTHSLHLVNLARRRQAVSSIARVPLFDPQSDGVPEEAPQLCRSAEFSLGVGSCKRLRSQLLAAVHKSPLGWVSTDCPCGLTCFVVLLGRCPQDNGQTKEDTNPYPASNVKLVALPTSEAKQEQALYTYVGGCMRTSANVCPSTSSIEYDVRNEWRAVYKIEEEKLEDFIGSLILLLGYHAVSRSLCLDKGPNVFDAPTESGFNLEKFSNDALKRAVEYFKADLGVIRVVDNPRFGGMDLVRTYFSNGSQQDDIRQIQFAEYESSVFLPVVVDNVPLAALSLHYIKKRIVTDQDVNQRDLYSLKLAMAFYEANSAQLERRSAVESNIIFDLSCELLRKDTYESVLAASCEFLLKMAKVDICFIFVTSGDNISPMRMAAQKGLSSQQAEHISLYPLDLHKVGSQILNTWQGIHPYNVSANSKAGPALADVMALCSVDNMLTVPIFSDTQLLGVAFLASSQGLCRFYDALIWKLMSMSVQISNALKRVILVGELQENLDRTRRFQQLTQEIVGKYHVNQLLNSIMSNITRFAEGHVISIAALDDTVASGYSVLSSLAAKNRRTSKFLNELTIRYLREGRLELGAVNFSSNKELMDSSAEVNILRAGFGGVFYLPLVVGEEKSKSLVGAITVFSTLNKELESHIVTSIKDVAEYFALAISNANLRANISARAQLAEQLHQLVGGISQSLRSQAVFTGLATSVVEIAKVSVCAVRLLEERSLVLKACSGADSSRLDDVIPVTTGFFYNVIKTKSLQIIMDSGTSAAHFPVTARALGIHTLLATPICSQSRVVGVISVGYRHDASYSNRNLAFLEAVGRDVGRAIENALLYDRKYEIYLQLREALLSSRGFSCPQLKNYHCYVPSNELSGDYYDIFNIEEDKFAVVIADVVGKGPPAATMALKVRQMVRDFAIIHKSPSQIMMSLNKQMALDPSMDDKPVTLFYIELNLKTRIATYVRAGHEKSICWSNMTKPFFMCPQGTSLGATSTLFAGMMDPEYEELSCPIEPGFKVLLYTDGVVDSCIHPDNMFGEERVMDLVEDFISSVEEHGCQYLVNKIHQEAKEFGGGKLKDDLSILVVEVP